MSGPWTYRRWRARRVWHRDPARALELLAPDVEAAGAGGDPEALSLHAWLALTHERDEAAAERSARAALSAPAGDRRFATAALAAVLLNRRAYDEAIDVLRAGAERHPEVPWYRLSVADALIEAARVDEAERLLEDAAAQGPPLRRHALKRLSRLALARGDRERARRFFCELIALAPDYLVYASDYVTAGALLLEAGNRRHARDVWTKGARTYPRNAELRALLAEHFGDERSGGTPNVPRVSEEHVGARRIPVRTPFITARTGLLPLLDEATATERRAGDVLVLAESAAAAGQGRVVPLELIRPGLLARLLSRFVGKIGPLHSHEGMEAAILEAGRPRVIAGAVAGAAGKLLRRRGWFYEVAGPGTAMIDDVAACMPPHDHHLLFGPRDADGLAAQLSTALGCEVAIVDANHLSGAWVVGATAGVDREWLTRVLADNPAGNEDEGTPVVLVRPLDGESGASGATAAAGASRGGRS